MTVHFGTIVQLNASDGGVPKTPLDSALVDATGITVDKQRNTQSHGGPNRALCLFAIETIEALQAQGHPIAPGNVGENITLRGVDWSRVVPGAQLRLGDDVIIEITRYTTPCSHIERYFHDTNSLHISQDHNPGRSRVYARVIHGGTLCPGDSAALFAAADGASDAPTATTR
jgi:MOSC domain-containing protein YiiM